MGLAGLLGLISACAPKFNTTVNISFTIPEEEAVRILAGKWLLMPIVPYRGLGRDMFDFGDFKGKIEKSRPGQQVILFGRKIKNFSPDQAEAFKTYVTTIQKKRTVPDSLFEGLVGDYNIRVALSPQIFSHQIIENEDGSFQRRLTLKVKGWDKEKQKVFLEGYCIAIAEGADKGDLISGEKLVEAALEALSEKIPHSVLAGLEPKTKPDF